MKNRRREGRALNVPAHAEDEYWKCMPFAPTGAQARTLTQIAADLRKPVAMARMVQGDVGCGKTALAFGAMRMCAEAGCQAALMAPTEILARQHYESAKKVLAPMGVSCGLLWAACPPAERRHALARSPPTVAGSHRYPRDDRGKRRVRQPPLCVTDEQHRFGVRQRTQLLQKGGGLQPPLLVMSATPIPRTLALAMFGDLDVSVVDELPPGRLPVHTRVVPVEKRADMYRFVRENEKPSGYVVCPLVEGTRQTTSQGVVSLIDALCRGPLKASRQG